MKTIFKNTLFDILISKTSIYFFIIGLFFIVLTPGRGIILKFEAGNMTRDFSSYGKLILFHIFLYIFFAIITASITNEIEEEFREGFHQIPLIYISRIKYFLAKFFAYALGYFLILFIVGGLGLMLSNIIFKTSLWGLIVALFLLICNIIFVIILSLFLILSKASRKNGLFAFLLYIFFSFLSSKTIVKWLIISDGLSGIISTVVPSVFWLQNEFLKFGMGWGFSHKIFQYLLNVIAYIIILSVLLVNKIKKYECKA